MEAYLKKYITENMTNLTDAEPLDCDQCDLTDAFETMDQFRKDNLLCDVVLKCGDKSFPCHKIVLASRIPYFEVMFSSRMMEITQKEIEIKDFDPTILETFLSYAYNGELCLDQSNVYTSLASALYWNLDDVTEKCVDYIAEELLCANNVFDIKEFAMMLNCTDLNSCCIQYVEHNFKEISDSEHFQQILYSDLKQIIKIDVLPVREELIFEAVMKWINFNPDRHKYLSKLLAELRLTLIEADYLKDKILTNYLISSNEKCRNLVLEAMRYRSMPYPQQMTYETKQTMTPRAQNNGAVYVFGGMRIDQCFENDDCSPDEDYIRLVDTTEIYVPYSDLKSETTSMANERYKFGVAVLNEKLYAIGGKQYDEDENLADCFDPRTEKWSAIASMQAHRMDVGVCALNDHIYACGGSYETVILQTCERYSPICDSWESINSMKEARCGAGVVSLYGCVWAIGGKSYGRCLNSVERYDPRETDWQSEENMIEKRARFGCATLYGKIYVMGGHDGKKTFDSVEIYDPRNKKWQFGTPMEYRSRSLSIVENMGRLYVVGGLEKYGNGVSVKSFDPEENKWRTYSTLESRRLQFCSAILPYVDN